MKIVAVICQKGGVGKTNLSIHLATAAALAGHRTAIIDLDPQGTASSWGDLRKADDPEVISGQATRLPMLIEAAKANRADLIVIDTPPQADSIALAAAKVADLVLVPIRMDRDNRAHHAQYRIRRDLCERGNFDPDEWDLPPKPKWMRQRTYERIEAKYDHYDAILDDGLVAAAARLMAVGGFLPK